MKTKKFSKKLNLNKKTIVDLNNDDMRFVNGGATSKCETWVPEESVCLICTSLCPTDYNPVSECCSHPVSECC